VDDAPPTPRAFIPVGHAPPTGSALGQEHLAAHTWAAPTAGARCVDPGCAPPATRCARPPPRARATTAPERDSSHTPALPTGLRPPPALARLRAPRPGRGNRARGELAARRRRVPDAASGVGENVTTRRLRLHRAARSHRRRGGWLGRLHSVFSLARVGCRPQPGPGRWPPGPGGRPRRPAPAAPSAPPSAARASAPPARPPAGAWPRATHSPRHAPPVVPVAPPARPRCGRGPPARPLHGPRRARPPPVVRAAAGTSTNLPRPPAGRASPAPPACRRPPTTAHGGLRVLAPGRYMGGSAGPRHARPTPHPAP
jgi:hypothetical protein